MDANKPESPTSIAEGLPPAPPSRDEFDEQAEPQIRVNDSSAMQVFFAWEKLRVVYNAVLILIVVAVCGPTVILILGEAILSALAANLMFCAGPVGESYLSWLGVPRIIARWITFIFGMVIAAVITGLAAFEVPPLPNR